jgi:quinol monooxygenase YgiN
MVHVIAITTTKPGQRDSVLQLLQANAVEVRAEEGCIQYEATIDASPGLVFQTPFGPDTFVVIGKWKSPEALQAHLSSPHMAMYANHVRDMIGNRTIHVLAPA